MGEPAPLAGPDLTLGVAESKLPEGGMLLGHAHGEAVLLARSGGSVHAVSATCTHWGGPLAEGRLDGTQVRCPWHHAGFDITDGRATCTPALKPLTRYEVIRRSGTITVGARLESHAPARAAEEPAERMVIIGAGGAGNAAAEELRKEGYRGAITMIGAEPDLPYDRPNLSKDYLAGNAPEEWIPLRDRAFYDDHDIELLLEQRIESVDPSARQVRFGNGRTLAYDRLLLATGAEPIRLDLPGADQPHVCYLRSLADSRELIRRASKAKRVLVIGASFIGLEVAAALRARGLAVTVVAPETVLFERVLGADVGAWIRSLHEAKGVTFHLGDSVTAIGQHEAQLRSGGRVAADLVVIGVGVRPRLGLAEAAGLAIDKGVVVDEFLRTSAPGIYAAGDIARYPDPVSGGRVRIEHWVVAERQGQAAARNMMGREAPFRDVPFFWSTHYDRTVSYTGHAEGWDEAVLDGSLEGGDAMVRYVKDGKTLAVATVGRDRDNLDFETGKK